MARGIAALGNSYIATGLHTGEVLNIMEYCVKTFYCILILSNTAEDTNKDNPHCILIIASVKDTVFQSCLLKIL